MSYLRNILVGALLLAVLILPSSANAASLSELQAQIAALLAQVKTLQTQIDASQSTTPLLPTGKQSIRVVSITGTTIFVEYAGIPTNIHAEIAVKNKATGVVVNSYDLRSGGSGTVNFTVPPTSVTTGEYILQVQGGTKPWPESAPFNLVGTAPSCKVTVDGSKVTWSSTGATTATSDLAYAKTKKYGSVPVNGSETVAVTVPTGYSFWFVGPGGRATCTSPVLYPKTVGTTITVLSPNGGELLELNKAHTIRWKQTGTGTTKVAVTKNDQWVTTLTDRVAIVKERGDRVGSYSYSLKWTPSGSLYGGTSDESTASLGKVFKIKVWAQDAIDSVTAEDQSDASFGFKARVATTTEPLAPSITITSSKDSSTPPKTTITWAVSNATRCYMQYGTVQDQVALQGARVVSPEVTTTYTLRCGNEQGEKDGPVTEKKIVVKGSYVAPAAPSITFTSSQAGSSPSAGTTLTWKVTNATRCYMQYGEVQNQVALEGTRVVSPDVTTTYTLRCGNEQGEKDGPVTEKKIVVKGTVPTTPTTTTATYRGYLNGQLFITTENMTKADALSNCKQNSTRNPNASIRCTWGSTEIYKYSPSTTSGDSWAGKEVQVVGVYEGALPGGVTRGFQQHPEGTVNVTVTGSVSSPAILVLTSYEPVNWNITKNAGADIARVITAGYHAQRVSGLPSSIPVEHHSYATDGVVQYAYSNTSPEFHKLDAWLQGKGGKITTFTGSYSGKDFTVYLGAKGSVAKNTQLANALTALQSLLETLKQLRK